MQAAVCVCWVWFPCDEVACAGGACEEAAWACGSVGILEQTLYEEWCGVFCDISCNVRDRQPLTLCP